MEKGFPFQDTDFMGYTGPIYSVVEQHGWQLFFLHPDDVLTKVVKEFYAHLTSPNNAFIYTITTKGLNQVLANLCVKGTKWIVSQNVCYTIDRVSMKPYCREVLSALEMLKEQFPLIEKQQLKITTDLRRALEEMALFWSYVRRMDNVIKKNFTRSMPTFPTFPKELLSNPEDLDQEEVKASATNTTTHPTTVK
ncbi:hypothetical protein J1N35_007318 [Gossypium stocksii]|uniref:Uncharacterized protein n=1 Tax=Gossypium stocksii TaxID=47602 RepID=A0A9D4AFH2_9ROSI|nr:hypothetical protein J1N35_007318 [Gossypium stocksii]